VQFIKSNGRYFFIDFNPRYAAGGLMLTVMAGANIPLMSIQLMMGRRFSVPSIQPNLIMTRYWEEIML
jgi:biotin carboxylase